MTLSIENAWLKAEFNTKGAELTSLTSQTTQIQYLWQGDATFWGRQAPVLFPIVGKLKNDTYTVDGQEYHLSQHGFARDKEFNVISHEKEKIVFSLKSDDKTLALYPFDFELQLHYVLEENSLTTQYVVKNTGHQEMLYAIGGHPAYNVPIDGVGTFEDYRITTNTQPRMHLPLNNGIDLDNSQAVAEELTLELTRELFSQDALVYAADGFNSFMIESDKTLHSVEVSYQGMPFVGIWSPYPKEAPFVCIEPWLGIADTVHATGDFSDKFGINRLVSGAEQICAYKTTIK